MTTTILSFIVPALNEEAIIGGLVRNICEYCPDDIPHEVVVVDNGSSDRTVETAKRAGAMVLSRPDGTIGQMRNEGAKVARGRVLVFLDADVRLSEAWSESIEAVLEKLSREPKTITGSSCSAPPNAGWVARAWADFSHRPDGLRTHIGTGHLIVDRRSFLNLGGFDPSLETGEDFEFCRRAIKKGFELRPESALFVTHARLPINLREFVRREIWHGAGDSRELRRLLRSRVAIAAFTFVILHALAVVLFLAGPGGDVWGWALASMAAVGFLCVLSAVRRGGGRRPGLLIQRSVLFYFYFWARFFAVLRGVKQRYTGIGTAAGKRRGW